MSRVKEFTLPDLGEGLTEGEILAWLVSVGDTVTQNQPIVEVETAKAAVEIPAKWAGQVTAIFHAAGETIEVGTPIIAIDTQPGSGPLEPPPVRPSAAALAAVTLAGDAPVEPGMVGSPAPSLHAGGPANGSAAAGRTPVLVGYGPRTTAAKRRTRVPAAPVPPPAPAESTAPPAPEPTSTPALAKPPVRKLARDLGIDLHALTGTGPGGVVTRDDVLTAVPATAGTDGSRERRVAVKGVRKLTAEHMVASAFTAPHVTEFLTVDMTRSMRAAERLRTQRDWQDTRITPLLFVAKAVLLAIARHPMVNSTWAGDEIVVKEYVNLGIAAATERGLIVPNVADADRLTMRELADALTALAATAKDGRTTPAAMAGGTFTITNVGVFGVDTGTPILPPGEAAILAFGAVREMPWVHRGKIKARQVSTLALSFDHRVIDGELGSRFLRDVGAFLTDPGSALLAWS